MSGSLGLVDFSVRLVDSVLCLPNGQGKFFGKSFEEMQLLVRDEIYCIEKFNFKLQVVINHP